MKQDHIIGALLVILVTVTAANSFALMSVGEMSAASLAGAPWSPPGGIPARYGAELGVSLDDVSPYDQAAADMTIRTLGRLDVDIQLTPEQNARYVDILYRMEGGISCEYCCGARSVVFESGEAACGCAHSYAMRGLAKYLIAEHGDEYTDQEIFAEVAKWKARFFPGQLAAKAAVLEEKGIEPTIINLASNQYRGIEKGATGGGMVGGC